jgi:hypothetical protein
LLDAALALCAKGAAREDVAATIPVLMVALHFQTRSKWNNE